LTRHLNAFLDGELLRLLLRFVLSPLHHVKIDTKAKGVAREVHLAGKCHCWRQAEADAGTLFTMGGSVRTHHIIASTTTLAFMHASPTWSHWSLHGVDSFPSTFPPHRSWHFDAAINPFFCHLLSWFSWCMSSFWRMTWHPKTCIHPFTLGRMHKCNASTVLPFVLLLLLLQLSALLVVPNFRFRQKHFAQFHSLHSPCCLSTFDHAPFDLLSWSVFADVSLILFADACSFSHCNLTLPQRHHLGHDPNGVQSQPQQIWSNFASNDPIVPCSTLIAFTLEVGIEKWRHRLLTVQIHWMHNNHRVLLCLLYSS